MQISIFFQIYQKKQSLYVKEMPKEMPKGMPDMEPGCEDEVAKEGDWDNAPDEKYQDTAYMQNDLAGGLNRQKKSYPKVAGGDNPMALEDEIRAELQSKLSEIMKEGKGMPSKSHIMKMCKDGKTKAEICKMHPDCDQPKLKAMIDDCKKEMKESVNESVEVIKDPSNMSFVEMLKLVKESGGQQQIDPVDETLWNWAQRVATSKVEESEKAEIENIYQEVNQKATFEEELKGILEKLNLEPRDIIRTGEEAYRINSLDDLKYSNNDYFLTINYFEFVILRHYSLILNLLDEN